MLVPKQVCAHARTFRHIYLNANTAISGIDIEECASLEKSPNSQISKLSLITVNNSLRISGEMIKANIELTELS